MPSPESSRSRRMAIVRHRNVYEVALQRESAAFVEAGFDVDVFMLADDEQHAENAATDGVTVHRLTGSKSRRSKAHYLLEYATFVARAGRALWREHRRRPFDVVQVNTMPDFLVLSTLALRLRGVKTTVFMKEPSPEIGELLYRSRLVVKLLTAFERMALRYADGAFAVTPELRQTFIDRGADSEKIKVVLSCPDPASLHLSRPPRVDPDRFVLVSHGTIEHRWGFDVMVEAVRVARERIPSIQLRLMGGGDYLDDVMRLVGEHDLGDHVVYLGWLDFDEVLAEVAGADGGIVAQLDSGYSNLVHTQKMYEFIMLGVPCLASRLRSVSRAFDDGELLFFEPDDPQSLADAMIELHDNPELATSLVARASQRYDASYRWEDQKAILVDNTVALLP